jgi:CRP-like cAMP-binding protein
MAASLADKAKFFIGHRFMSGQLFGKLSPKSKESLVRVTQTRQFEKGVCLVKKSETPNEILIIASGRARFVFGSETKGDLSTRLTAAGEILGLTEMISEMPAEICVETLSPCVCKVVKRRDFIRFLREEPDVCFRLLRMLGANLQKSRREFCDLYHKNE